MNNDTTITSSERDAQTRAAALLAGAARADGVTTEVALLCLASAEHLRAADVAPIPADVPASACPQAIAQALAILGGLPRRSFGLAAVLEAASHARRAHQLAT